MSDKEIANPFGNGKQEQNAIVASEVGRAVQEVQAQVILAKKYPRDQKDATDRILRACQRYTLAADAVYSFPKGGTQVTGASIRLAEAMAREWGNMTYGIVEQDRAGDESSMLAYAWDLESNVMMRAEYKVRHYRDTKGGGKVTLTDERDIYETVANYGARRLRACILKIIPGDVTEAAIKQSEQTIRAEIKDLKTATTQMVDSFSAIGVTKDQIEKRLRHRIEATQAAEIIGLRRIYASIKDGMSTPADWFEAETTQEPAKQGTKTRAKAVVEAFKNAKPMPEELDATGIPEDL